MIAPSTRVKPSVQLTELIRSTKATKQMRDQLIDNGASKTTNKPKLCINYQTNNKNGGSLQGYYLRGG